MSLPEHIHLFTADENRRPVEIAGLYVRHVKSCQFCLTRLLGLDRHEAVKHYTSDEATDATNLDMQRVLRGRINPDDEMFDQIVEILIWYYMISTPR